MVHFHSNGSSDERRKQPAVDTYFEEVYRIRVWEPALRELLLFKSIYRCRMISDIQSIIYEQKRVTKLQQDDEDFEKSDRWQIFYKVLLEFDIRSLIHILAFDQASMQMLLGEEDNKAEFTKMAQYPLFFLDSDGRSAIDNALDAS